MEKLKSFTQNIFRRKSFDEKIQTHLISASRIEVEMVSINGGSFNMGSTRKKNETPIHKVTVNDFAIGMYPITNGEYGKYCTAMGIERPRTFSWLFGFKTFLITIITGALSLVAALFNPLILVLEYKSIVSLLNERSRNKWSYPVVNISWYEATHYCLWLSKVTGRKFRLPTEAEWEYAAKANQEYLHSGATNLFYYGWSKNNSEGRLKEVMTKSPNNFGLYDMSGNVWEWCQDWYDNKYYSNSPELNPQGPLRIKSGLLQRHSARVLRGGSFLSEDDHCTVSFRTKLFPMIRFFNIGFRIVEEV